MQTLTRTSGIILFSISIRRARWLDESARYRTTFTHHIWSHIRSIYRIPHRRRRTRIAFTYYSANAKCTVGVRVRERAIRLSRRIERIFDLFFSLLYIHEYTRELNRMSKVSYALNRSDMAKPARKINCMKKRMTTASRTAFSRVIREYTESAVQSFVDTDLHAQTISSLRSSSRYHFAFDILPITTACIFWAHRVMFFSRAANDAKRRRIARVRDGRQTRSI